MRASAIRSRRSLGWRSPTRSIETEWSGSTWTPCWTRYAPTRVSTILYAASACPPSKPSASTVRQARKNGSNYPCNSTAYRPEAHLDSRDPLQDAGDQTKEEKSEEGLHRDRQASEEAGKAKREDGRCGRPEIRLAVFQRSGSGRVQSLLPPIISRSSTE